MHILVTLFQGQINNWYNSYKLENKVKKNEKNAGRKSFDPKLMFYLLIIKEYYHLSDEKTIAKVKDSNSISRILGKGVDIPSPKTLWHYKVLFSKSNLFEEFFKFVTDTVFQGAIQHISQIDIKAANSIYHHTLIDSTFLPTNWRRDSVEINEKIKQNHEKHQIYPNPHVASHKDIEASFTQKNGKLYFGYKQNIVCDGTTKLVLNVLLTTASSHDVKQLIPLAEQLEIKDTSLYADKGYAGNEYQEKLIDMGIKPKICKKASRSKPLDQEDKEWNKNVSKIRCRIEHIFSWHNDNKRFCSYSSKFAEIATFIQYTIYNIKRGISILNNKCKIINLDEVADEYQVN